ncbi:unnamed protein product [Caenorhabditis nigoni]
MPQQRFSPFQKENEKLVKENKVLSEKVMEKDLEIEELKKKAINYLKYLQGEHGDTFFRDLVIAKEGIEAQTVPARSLPIVVLPKKTGRDKE